MEFPNRKACIEHYQEQFPNLPRYMIEMALDYDLAQGDGSSSNEKPLTGKQRRKLKQAKKTQEPVAEHRDMNKQIQEALKNGKRLEIDSARILKADEYEMPPFVSGHIEMDGNAFVVPESEPAAEPKEVIEDVTEEMEEVN